MSGDFGRWIGWSLHATEPPAERVQSAFLVPAVQHRACCPALEHLHDQVIDRKLGLSIMYRAPLITHTKERTRLCVGVKDDFRRSVREEAALQCPKVIFLELVGVSSTTSTVIGSVPPLVEQRVSAPVDLIGNTA
jgi:hypothetical protein